MDRFEVGSKVVHPLQGLGVVKEIRKLSLLGEEVEVYVIETPKMELQIPLEKARELGIRKIVSEDKVETIFKILRSPAKDEPFTSPEGWHKRYEDLKRRIKNGAAKDLAEIVRDLAKNAKVYELNIKEREILSQAKDLLGQEITAASSMSKTKVAERMEEALKANVRRRAASR